MLGRKISEEEITLGKKLTLADLTAQGVDFLCTPVGRKFAKENKPEILSVLEGNKENDEVKKVIAEAKEKSMLLRDILYSGEN